MPNIQHSKKNNIILICAVVITVCLLLVYGTTHGTTNTAPVILLENEDITQSGLVLLEHRTARHC